LGFKVVRGHQCWYPQKARQQRARLVDAVAEIARFQGGTLYPKLMCSYGGLLEPRRSKCEVLKSMFNAENFIRRLSWSFYSDFDAVHS